MNDKLTLPIHKSATAAPSKSQFANQPARRELQVLDGVVIVLIGKRIVIFTCLNRVSCCQGHSREGKFSVRDPCHRSIVCGLQSQIGRGPAMFTQKTFR